MFEPAYFRDERAYVTAKVVELDGQTYPLAQIRTASIEEVDNPGFDWLRKVRALGFALVGLHLFLRVLFAYFHWPFLGLNGVFGLLTFIALGSALFANLTIDMLGKRYFVVLEGKFGTILALPSCKKRYVMKVAGAVRQAIQEVPQPGVPRLEDARTG